MRDGIRMQALVVAGLLALAGLVAMAAYATSPPGEDPRFVSGPLRDCNRMEYFENDDELAQFVGESPMWFDTPVFLTERGVGSPAAEGALSGGDHSGTNVQVPGVDEADIVKTDGRYVYAISAGKAVIIDAYPPEQAEVVATIAIGDMNSSKAPVGLFLSEDRLAVISSAYPYIYGGWERGGYPQVRTELLLYDVSDPTSPALVREVGVDGSYVGARLYRGVVYLITSVYVYEDPEDGVVLPATYVDGVPATLASEDIAYFRDVAGDASVTMVLAIDAVGDDEPVVASFMAGYASYLYVSKRAIYFVSPVYRPAASPDEPWLQRTAVHRVAFEGTAMEYECTAELPGMVLDQFSIDENDGYLRVATTVQDVQTVWFAEMPSSTNGLYVLDESFEVVGALEGLAEGESIYAARFLGDRAYLVTFRRVDPFFVIDLSDPTAPTVLGYLKTPGFSEYLHPLGEDRIVGFGYETTDEGTISGGLKVSLFDVSDATNPIEVDRYVVENAYSEATYDHKAFLLSEEKGILAFPVSRWDMSGSWSGAYVFDVSPEGFDLRGTVAHPDVGEGDYRYSPTVRRVLYIDDVLYTLSDSLLGMSRLSDLAELGFVEL